MPKQEYRGTILGKRELNGRKENKILF
uniref:Uncharacterized protein n=1 Tax=Rhizophora mucronata TaxID=61149 RepID=A0A2P2N7F1_RHIMU